LRKVPFSKERFTISVIGEIIEGRMDLATIVGMQSGSDDKEPFKLFTILVTSKSEAVYNTIDLRQGRPRKDL